ncbi:acetyl-CoA synthetase [bacterium (Candidatus Gribaldobacteria) CG07_land_8_20_14_0_80_33_18]|uniref:Acetyl-CoA synthetase n=1 Tax=bacterium (Candidatus Gribaldobacteria) CG07_land_8_20_14_0_80_33_18 TaxID=2014272 RepID=A0A2M6Z436_9BACT|nr:MAG: acetyl-CoA synthetase [bacterium (Candidatus Gribaldobacteria) CG07_land_8_20_14_0_80_33_18]PJA00397.1 MAG: acetyl-CoA synthetase [bacterium (Candidatus Gribaldobacteria) CG_4_10_14_0_2_um_filter_33_15]
MPLLNFQQTKKLLLKYKIPIYQTEIFNSEKKAEKFVKKIGYPVVLKIFSLTILHKTDMGGVKMNIKNNKELKKAFFDLIKIKRIEGILVQKMGAGKEIVLGMKRDFQFGPVLMFGLGGIFVEALKDVSFRICPVSKKEAIKMIKEIKGYSILKGQRGEKPLAIEKLAPLITKLSNLSLKEKNVKEIDLNPLIINEKGVWAADFKFLV